MAQQTAVEWLEQHLKDLETKIFNFEISPLDSPAIRENLYKQAKQMEKEQHSNTWTDARIHHKGDDYIGKEISFEQYYNETYNK